MESKQKTNMRSIIHWLPRVLAILFIVFISIFAFDVFEEPKWFLAFLIHLTPSFILVILTIIAWKHERFGGLLFLVTGMAMMLFFHSLVIASPAFLIGILFWIDSVSHEKHDTEEEE